MLKKIIALLFSIIMISVISGCHTVSGFGEDVQHVGGAIERTASK